MKAGLFFIAGGVLNRAHTKKVSHYAGLGRVMPVSMTAFTIAAISMVGLPPTAGFISKWYLVSGAVETNRWVPAVVIVAASVLTLAYFLRLLEMIWFRPLDPGLTVPAEEIREATRGVLVPVVVVTGAILLLGIASTWVISGVLQPVADRLLG